VYVRRVAVIDRLEAFERAERGADLHLELTRANALLDSGHSEDALKGFDRALEVARADDRVRSTTCGSGRKYKRCCGRL